MYAIRSYYDYGGLNKGVDAIFEVLTGEYHGSRKVDSPSFPPQIFFILFIIFIIIIISISKNKRGGNSYNFV